MLERTCIVKRKIRRMAFRPYAGEVGRALSFTDQEDEDFRRLGVNQTPCSPVAEKAGEDPPESAWRGEWDLIFHDGIFSV
jgi:hypothetical protein